jgi:hypothetical protein
MKLKESEREKIAEKLITLDTIHLRISQWNIFSLLVFISVFGFNRIFYVRFCNWSEEKVAEVWTRMNSANEAWADCVCGWTETLYSPDSLSNDVEKNIFIKVRIIEWHEKIIITFYAIILSMKFNKTFSFSLVILISNLFLFKVELWTFRESLRKTWQLTR